MTRRLILAACVLMFGASLAAAVTPDNNGYSYPQYIDRPWLVPNARVVVDTVCCHASWADTVVCDTLQVWTWTIEARASTANSSGIKYRFAKAAYETTDAVRWTAWDYMDEGRSYTWDCPLERIEIQGRGTADSVRCAYVLRLHRERANGDH